MFESAIGVGTDRVTETVTQTVPLTSSVVSTNLPQTGVVSSIPSATSSTSGSTTLPLGLSNPTSSRFGSHRHRWTRLGPIIGGVVALFVIILLLMFLVFLLLRRRAEQREIRLRAEVDPIPTPLDLVHTREGLGRHVSANDDGSRSEMPMPTVYSSHITPPANVDLKHARSNYTLHSSVHEDRSYLASESYTSDANPQAGNHSSRYFVTNGAITEENTPTYIPGHSQNETHHQTDPNFISTDYAPPAYDSLPSRTSPP